MHCVSPLSWLRLGVGPCALFMAIGKFVRYWLVAQAVFL